jgi:pyridoxamine 5'-phosphate oxidase
LPVSSSHIAAIRKDYQLAALDESIAGDNPIDFFRKWFHEATEAEVAEVNAMVLATVDEHNRPHARVVLLKGLEENGFVFFTNYDSAKGKELDKNPHAALVFYWQELERQVRIEGTVHRLPEAESDLYFITRPEGSRIGAWSSPQSQVIEDRAFLEENFNQFQSKFTGREIPRPPHWGGYSIVPTRIEFWQGRSNRMHDRICFTFFHDQWKRSRLAP